MGTHSQDNGELPEGKRTASCWNNELEYFLLSAEDDAISILSFAENACDEGGRKKFAVLETKRGIEEDRTLLRGSARKPAQKLQGAAGSQRAHDREAEQAFDDNRAKAKIDERSLG